MFKTLLNLSLFAVIAYLVLLAALYFLQRKLIYFPPSHYYSPAQVGLDGFEEIELKTADGLRVTPWWIAPKGNQPVVMFFHGNASAVYGAAELYRELHSEGFGVFAVSYIGYPGAQGKPSQQAIVDAAVQQFDFLTSQLNVGGAVALYGTSLGAGVAAQVAAKRQPAIVISEAPFLSVLSMARSQYPFVPVSLMLKDTYRSDLALNNFEGPLLWLHGTDDTVIPLSQGQALYEGFSGSKSHALIKGANHNDIWSQGGSRTVINTLKSLDP